MNIFRYINRLVIGIIMFIPFFVILIPFFKWLDWVFEDKESDNVTSDMIGSYWNLFKMTPSK